MPDTGHRTNISRPRTATSSDTSSTGARPELQVAGVLDEMLERYRSVGWFYDAGLRASLSLAGIADTETVDEARRALTAKGWVSGEVEACDWDSGTRGDVVFWHPADEAPDMAEVRCEANAVLLLDKRLEYTTAACDETNEAPADADAEQLRHHDAMRRSCHLAHFDALERWHQIARVRLGVNLQMVCW